MRDDTRPLSLIGSRACVLGSDLHDASCLVCETQGSIVRAWPVARRRRITSRGARQVRDAHFASSLRTSEAMRGTQDLVQGRLPIHDMNSCADRSSDSSRSSPSRERPRVLRYA